MRFCMVPLLIASLSGCGSGRHSSETSRDGTAGSLGTELLPCSEKLRVLLDTDFSEDRDVLPTSSIGGYCDYRGSRLVVAVFLTAAALEKQLDDPVGPGVWFVAGDRWIVSAGVRGWACDEREEAAAVASELHGEVRSLEC